MPTNEERREVARRLRELDHSDLQESLICAYLDALGIKGYEDWIGIAHRLADLIEPSCDRDALLRLARYMDKDVAETEAHFSNVVSTESVSDYARRIREACGEVRGMAGIKTLGFAVEDHDPRSWELYQFIADMDYENGDTFCFKAGGDGDNGELILSYLDEWFALAERGER